MNTRERKLHKLCNLLRFGRKQGWVILINGQIVIASWSPQYFHEKLSRFESLFRAEKEAPLPLP